MWLGNKFYGGIPTKGAERFFEKYQLSETVQELIDKAFKEGYIATPLGNKRIVEKEEDRVWILNHYIQGTSSLIFKQALINVKKKFGNNVELVLPVHDAALFKVHQEINQNRIILEFKNAYSQWIKDSNPIVKVKNFFGGVQ